MNNVNFDEVKDIFQNGCIWIGRKEMFWYQHAWTILGELGATQYETELEHAQIQLYAATLAHVYFNFSKYAFEEGCELTGIEIINYSLPEVAIGQIASSFNLDGSLYEDVEDAFQDIFFANKYKIFQLLKRKMTEIDVMVWMYATGKQLTIMEKVVPNEEFDGIAENELWEDVDYEPETYEQFAKWVEQNYTILWEEIEEQYSMGEAYDYICNLM